MNSLSNLKRLTDIIPLKKIPSHVNNSLINPENLSENIIGYHIINKIPNLVKYHFGKMKNTQLLKRFSVGNEFITKQPQLTKFNGNKLKTKISMMISPFNKITITLFLIWMVISAYLYFL
ncbi:MAG: hypothetical protein ACTSWY_13380 [Promethearchaeota archaeon]